MESSPWNVQEQAMQQDPDDDFHRFFNPNGMGSLVDGLSFEYAPFAGPDSGHGISGSSRDQMDTAMSGTDVPAILSRTEDELQRQMSAIAGSTTYQSLAASTLTPDPIHSIDVQIQFLQQQKIRHQQRQMEEQHAAAFFARQQASGVPPTPRSLDIQPGNGRYFPVTDRNGHHQAHPSLDYRYQRMPDQQDISFTPLVSPAVTPLETHFPMDAHFAIPGAYFSPLTSPALLAQNESITIFNPRQGPINISSPPCIDSDLLSSQVTTSSGDATRKSRKQASKGRGSLTVKQSPKFKAQRRKTPSTAKMSAHALTELREAVKSPQDYQAASVAISSASSTAGATDSENGSLSPETLTETGEMPPPPLPRNRSAKPSPHFKPQMDMPSTHTAFNRPGDPSPATPASLMKLSSPSGQASTQPTGHASVATEKIESFELPEAATAKVVLSCLDTKARVISPTDGWTNMKYGEPVSSPVCTQPSAAASASQSPKLMPTLGSTSTSAKKTPQLAARRNKKRESISSVHESPAVLPKISPNIKPLLPGGLAAEESASRLLATKSNYQRILEGNTLPGVSYPSELSTNLTSKRTSHKIAEQGRRNRINQALLEMTTLLPRQPSKEGSEVETDAAERREKEKEKEKAGTPSSKANTVEMAIAYIKQLKKEVELATRRAEEAEKRLSSKMEGQMTVDEGGLDSV